MKKMLSLLLALALVFSLAACGSTGAPAPAEPTAAPAEEEAAPVESLLGTISSAFLIGQMQSWFEFGLGGSMARASTSDSLRPPARLRSSRCRAMRWADLGPTPGNARRASTSSVTSGLRNIRTAASCRPAD